MWLVSEYSTIDFSRKVEGLLGAVFVMMIYILYIYDFSPVGYFPWLTLTANDGHILTTTER